MSDLPRTSDFLAVAREHALLSAEALERLSQLLTVRGESIGDVALSEGLLDAVEVDIISTLQHAHDAAPGYEFLGVLGRGGMGVVFRARQKALDREVAIKTLLLSQLSHRDALARFEREARTIGRLQHPNVVAAYDFGKHQGRVYLAMELVPGHDLGHHIHRHQRLDEHAAWSIARQIALGLAHAHSLGIVHRDIKPANVLVVRDSESAASSNGVPWVKISDFGLSILAVDDLLQTRLTLPGRVVGTPNFMAPEQLAGEAIDCRADIYALGGTIYNMLTGEPPFAGQNLTQLMSSKQSGAAPPIRERAPQVSDATVKLLDDMMASDVSRRIADYEALLARIDDVLAQLGRPTAPPAKPVAPPKKAPTVFLGIIALALLLLAVSGFLAWRRSGPLPQPTFVQGEWKEDLFSGAAIDGWRYEPGTLLSPDADAEGSRVLALQGSATRTWRAVENYRITFGVAMGDAEAIEIQFAPTGERGFGDCHALRLDATHVRLLQYRQGKARVQHELPQPTSTGETLYRSVQIERHGTHLWIYYEGDVAGTLPVHVTEERSSLRLVVEGGRAFFEGIQIEELVPPADANRPPK